MIEQGTPEWHQERCGKVTASRFADVLAFLKSGAPAQARLKYMREIAFEILSGVPKQSVSAAALKWGKEIEGYAREAYELQTGNIITTSGFLTHPKKTFVGCSPDGFVEEDGGVEIKCPHDETVHVQTLIEGMPEDHIAQVQGNMLVTGRQWWDFISFDPRQAEPYRIFIQRVPRDRKFIEKLEESIESFWKEACAMVDDIKQKKAA
jgi:putative phage-type endonuclease